MAPSIAIVGSGAVGGFLTCMLSSAKNCKLSVVSRGEALRQLVSKGEMKLVLAAEGGEQVASAFRAVDAAHTGSVGHQDYVISCVKGNNLADALPSIRPLVGPETCVITLQNGLPFWHNCAVAHPSLAGKPLKAVDPDGALLRAFNPRQLAGCVTYIAVEKTAPAVVKINHARERARFYFGEALSGPSPRLDALAHVFRDAGINAFVDESITDRIWSKLMVSTSANTTNFLTGGLAYDLVRDAGMRAVMRNILEEVQAVGAELGVTFERSADAELQDLTERFPKSKFSMLQDAEAGRELEVAPYVTAVLEVAAAVGVKMPTFETIAALVRHWADNHPPQPRLP